MIIIVASISIFLFISWKKKIFVFKKIQKIENNESNPTTDSTLQTLGKVKDDRNGKQNFQKIEELINDSNLKIESNEITKLGEIGRGAFGIVYKGIQFLVFLNSK